MKKATAAVLLVIAAAVYYVQRYPLATEITPETAHVAKLLRGHPQRTELAAFYEAVADLLPRMKQPMPAARFREILAAAVEIRFGDSFKQVPGLGEAIHGPTGAIAQLYGLESGQLDVPKMQRALRTIAAACR